MRNHAPPAPPPTPPPPTPPTARVTLSAVFIQTDEADQVQFAVSFRRSTKYSMPDTDDEGSVADSVADTGGVPMATADTRGGDEDTKVKLKEVQETWWSGISRWRRSIWRPARFWCRNVERRDVL